MFISENLIRDMKDINGIDLEKGQIIIAATKSTGLNIPVLKKAEVLEVSEEEPRPYIVIKYIKMAFIFYIFYISL